MPREKIYIGWEEIHKDTKDLCAKIKTISTNFCGIVVITRGGLIPAGIISSELNIKNIDVFNITSYNANNQSSNLIVTRYPKLAIEAKGKDWLIIDDLIDTGNTAKYIKQQLPEATLATLYTKTLDTSIGVDIYIRYYHKKYWLCFPWSIYDF